MKMTDIIFACALLTETMSGVAAQEITSSSIKGRQLAEQHCSRCHVVDPSRPFMGIFSTPSFKLMVNALEDWEERFSSFHSRLPHQSIVRFQDEEPNPDVEDLRPPVELKYEDIDALVAYARTLIDN